MALTAPQGTDSQSMLQENTDSQFMLQENTDSQSMLQENTDSQSMLQFQSEMVLDYLVAAALIRPQVRLSFPAASTANPSASRLLDISFSLSARS